MIKHLPKLKYKKSTILKAEIEWMDQQISDLCEKLLDFADEFRSHTYEVLKKHEQKRKKK